MKKIILGLTLLILLFSPSRSPKDAYKNTEAGSYFSSTYPQARDKFLKAAVQAGAQINHYKNPATGAYGEKLYTDTALIGPSDSDNILLIISGTHGIEGFAGSAIQTGLLREGISEKLPHNTSILMVHALSPYGFSHMRRFDEKNIDPNRNFLDHTLFYPHNSGYESLSRHITPDKLSLSSGLRSITYLVLYGVKNGWAELRSAISGGQHSHPEGLFYGGISKSWSYNTLESIAGDYLSKATRVILIDIHTGLGSFGSTEMISNHPHGTYSYRSAKAIWGSLVRTSYSGESVSPHLYHSLKLALPDALVTSVSMEFGTLSQLRVFWALRNENWLLRQENPAPALAGRIQDDLLMAFYPEDSKWRDTVWLSGRENTEKALNYLYLAEIFPYSEEGSENF